MYENVQANLTLVLLFVHTEVEYGKGLLKVAEHSFQEPMPNSQ